MVEDLLADALPGALASAPSAASLATLQAGLQEQITHMRLDVEAAQRGKNPVLVLCSTVCYPLELFECIWELGLAAFCFESKHANVPLESFQRTCCLWCGKGGL